jgi:hypothetical protein
VPAGENASAHRPGIVIELHFHEGGTHPRRLSGTLLRARAEADETPRQPAQQPQSGKAERDRQLELPARRQERRPAERTKSAGEFHHRGQLARVDAGKGVARP